MSIKKSTCGIAKKNMDIINEVGEIIIDGIEYTILVGPCKSEFPPHFHINSPVASLIIPIVNISGIKIVKQKKEISIDSILSFLNIWLKESHHSLSIFSSLDFCILIWNANNPDRIIAYPDKKPNPLPRTIPKQNYVATIFVGEEPKITGYTFFITRNEISKFTSKYLVGDYFEGELITNVTIL